MIEYTPDNIARWTRLGMRKSFGVIMEDITEDYENIVILAADVASSAGLLEFQNTNPDKFYNIGIAEQNMVGIAAGLAKEGYNVFITSFAPFVALRAFEAIRTLVGYMKLNVKVVALASGLSLGSQGNTHYCLEDLSLMRTIPGMRILSPADCIESAKCLEFLAGYDGPAYLRLTGIDGSPGVYKGDYSFEAEKNFLLREGNDVIILGTGSIVNECVRASRALKKEGISGAVADVHTVKPLDTVFLNQIYMKYRLIVTVEEHSVSGGLGGAVAEHMAAFGNYPPLLSIGIQDVFPKAGDYSYLLQQTGLSAIQIKDRIMQKLE